MHATMAFGNRAVYDPDTLSRIGKVFDDTWATIAHHYDAGTREAARLKLATTIFQFAASGDSNPLELKCRAIGAMRLPSTA
jgi:hypothetical protein